MVGNNLVALPVLLRGHANVRALLPIYGITQNTQGFDELWPADITGYFHRAMT